MGLLNSHFIRAERYLKVDGDGYFTPPIAQILKRPTLSAVALYGALSIAFAKNEDDMAAKILLYAPVVYVFSDRVNKAGRNDVRIKFNSENNTKVIDTIPDNSTMPTHPVDYATAKEVKNSSRSEALFYGGLAAIDLTINFTNGYDTAFGIVLSTYFLSRGVNYATTTYVMNNVVNGKWQIERKPPKEENEYAARENFSLPAPLPV